MHELAFTLTTDRFNSTEAKPHFINARCFGEDFAAWLVASLSASGLDVAEPIQEDWGWCVIAESAGKSFSVSVGITDESIGERPAEWRVGVADEPAMDGLMSMFTPFPTDELHAIASKLRSILAAEPAFTNLREET